MSPQRFFVFTALLLGAGTGFAEAGKVEIQVLDLDSGGTLDVGTFQFLVAESGAEAESLITAEAIMSSAAGDFDAGAYRVGWTPTEDGGLAYTLVGYAMAGDSELDGDVDFDDLGRLLNSYGTASGWPGGDFDYSGLTDFDDLGVLLNNYGGQSSTLQDATSVLPEPTGLSLMLLGGAFCARYRRRNL